MELTSRKYHCVSIGNRWPSVDDGELDLAQCRPEDPPHAPSAFPVPTPGWPLPTHMHCQSVP